MPWSRQDSGLIRINSVASTVTNSSIVKAKSTHPIEVIEYSDLNLVLMLETQFQQVGAMIRLKGQIQVGESQRDFDFTAKTQLIKLMDEGLTRVELILVQFEKVLWAQFLAGMKERQNHSDKTFKMVKGEG